MRPCSTGVSWERPLRGLPWEIKAQRASPGVLVRYGTHSLRRTKATLIYKRTKNIRAIQLLLGHSNLESTVRYLGVEVDDALEISEQVEI
jgi:integrase